MEQLMPILTTLSDEVIKPISAYHQVASDRFQLAQQLTRPAYLKQVWQQWSREERELFSRFLWSSQGMIKERDLFYGRQNDSPASLRMALMRLRQQGWLYLFRDEKRERIYVCPLEIRKAVVQAKLDAPFASVHDVQGSTAPTMGIWQALFHFFVSLEQEPWMLTRTGQLPKRQAQKLDIDLDLDPEALRDTKWSKNDGIPAWIHLLVDVAEQMRLVQRDQEQLTLNRERFLQWMQLSWEETVRVLYQAVRTILCGEWEGGEGYWLLMEQTKPGTWVFVKDLVIAKQTLIEKKLIWSKEITQLEGKILKPLQALGWIELGEAKGGFCFGWLDIPPWSSEPAAECQLYVQPDLEVLVPYAFPFHQRYLLAQFADFMGGDQLLRYELNEASVQRAFKQGFRLEQLLSDLEKWSLYPVPELVKQQMTHWAERCSIILLETVVLIHLSDELTADQLEEEARRGSWNVYRLNNTCYSVLPAYLSEVTEWLKQMGKEAHQLQPTTFHLRSVSLPTEQEWLRTCSMLDNIRVENRYPDLDEAIPGVKHLPKLWTTGLRNYHLSMQQEILKHAVKYQLDVLLEVKGERWLVTPRKISLIAGEPILQAWKKEGDVRISIHEIERLQIFVPS